MTIKLEHETILRVLEHPRPLRRLNGRSSSSTSSAMQIPRSSPSSSKKLFDDLSLVDIVKSSHVEQVPGLTGEDDDTLSTASMSSDETIERRVTFCDEVVTEIWSRPFTEKDDIPNLYYSSEDTARFRQDYRLEKRLLVEESVDPEVCHVGGEKEEPTGLSSSHQGNAYRISRVVVLHNDILETFVDHQKETNIDGFFDNDSFWSGSITWY